MSLPHSCYKATEDVWETLKDTINNLYVVQNKTLPDVMSEMKLSHNLTATKAQYERHLTKWGFKKNTSREVWTKVGMLLKERGEQGKDSVVTIAGKKISRKKLKKEMQRYRCDLNSGTEYHLHSQDLPVANVRAHTPTDESSELELVFDTNAGSQAEMLQSTNSFFHWHSPLPILSFYSRSTDQIHQTNHHQECQHSFWGEFSSSQFEHFLPYSISRFEPTAQNLQYSDLLLRIGIKNACSEVFTESIGPDTLSAMLPRELFSNSAFGSSTKDLISSASTQILSIVALYMVSNCLIPPKHEQAKCILEWFQLLGNQSLLKSLFRRRDPTSQATLTNMFLYAVIAENVAVLKALPAFAYSSLLNEPHTWFSSSRSYNALDYACIRQNRELCISLVSMGATNSIALYQILKIIEVLKVREHQSSEPMGRIQFDIDLIRILIKNDIVVCRCFEPNYSAKDDMSSFPIAFSLDNLELMELLLKSHQCIGDFTWIKHVPRVGKSSAMLALLLNTGVKVPLRIAIESQDMKALQRILENGSTLNWKDLELVCEQLNLEFIINALELYQKHRFPSKSGDPLPFATAEQLNYACNNSGPYYPDSSPISVLDNEQAKVSKSRRIGSIISHILRLPPMHSAICLDNCLHAAVESSCEYSVKELMRAGACTTPKLLSRVKGSNMASLLLNSIWFTPEDTDIESCFKAAVEAGDSIAVGRLLDAGFSVNGVSKISLSSKFNSPLVQAIRCEKFEILSQLLERGADVNDRSSFESSSCLFITTTPLAAAIQKRNTDLVHHLLQLGADVEDEYALRIAVIVGHEMVHTLLTARSLKLCRGRPKFAIPALQLAIIRKDVPIVRSLLEHDASVHEYWSGVLPFTSDFDTAFPQYKFRGKQTALETAIIEDRDADLPIFRLLLSAWKILNSPWIGPTWDRTCPLSLAVKHSNYHVIDLLLSEGPDLNANIQGHSLQTPLQIASQVGDLHLVQKFISLGADVNATTVNRFHLPALQHAAKKGFLNIAQLLLGEGAYVDAPGPRPYLWTALELAAQNGRVDMIQLLVNHGAQLLGMGATQFERAKKLAAKHKFSAVTNLLDSLLAKQLASLNHNFQGQSVFIGSDGDGQGQKQTGDVPLQIPNSEHVPVDGLGLHSHSLSEDDLGFWNGVSSL